MSGPLNHKEARELAGYTYANSNLARCYLDIEGQLARRDALLREADIFLSEWAAAGNSHAGKLHKRIQRELGTKGDGG